MTLKEFLEKIKNYDLDKPVEIVFVDIYGNYNVIDVTRPDNRDVVQLICSPTEYYKQLLKERDKPNDT